MATEISAVIPAYNEEENIIPLGEELAAVLNTLKRSYEIIFIDDGSTDSTAQKVAELRQKNKNVRLIQFRKNFGQTASLDAGFKHAKGSIIVSLDADMQNDPNDIPAMIAELEKSDAVVGWRKHRKDALHKRLFSKFANALRKTLTGERIHDSGCTLKAIKREAVENLDLYGEMHRFIPALLMWKGFKVSEIVVRHRPRYKGRTKYNFKRLLKGFLDLLVVKFWMQYSTRPIHLFGGLGILLGFLGGIAGLYLLSLKFFRAEPIANRPLLLLAVLLAVLGTQLILFGFIADILIKTHYKGQPPYSIKRIM
ncbi:glycosyltransferase family 2 protein [Candidatus Woesearchaeota archaeon]|nr:glycosyltransferase family 2 protein [Candidatus Woesearchaeota archaeon]